MPKQSGENCSISGHVFDNSKYFVRGAICRSPIESTLKFIEVKPRVYAHRGLISVGTRQSGGDLSNIGFIIGDESVAVIDSGGTRATGEAVWRTVRSITQKPISHVILTHMHPDHIFGASVFSEDGAQIVGHFQLQRALSDRAHSYITSFRRLLGEQNFIGTDIPSIDIELNESSTIDLGNKRLRLDIWPTAHTATDLTVLDESSGTFFAGDLLFHQHAPALDGSLRGWQKVLKLFEQLDASIVVPGHGDPMLAMNGALMPMKNYLDVLAADTKAAIDKGLSLGHAIDKIAQSERKKWELFDAFNPRNATTAFTELEWE